MEVLEQPRMCQASDRECTSSEGSTTDKQDVYKCRTNKGHRKYACIILARTVLSRTKGADSTNEV
eukprot:10972596-Prorocentrum_lima.AAC.1